MCSQISVSLVMQVQWQTEFYVYYSVNLHDRRTGWQRHENCLVCFQAQSVEDVASVVLQKKKLPKKYKNCFPIVEYWKFLDMCSSLHMIPLGLVVRRSIFVREYLEPDQEENISFHLMQDPVPECIIQIWGVGDLWSSTRMLIIIT